MYPTKLPARVAKAIERGWSVFPLKGNKKPFFKWGRCQNELATIEQATEWQMEYAPPLWAIATGAVSGVIVADIDAYAPGAITTEALGLAGKENVITGSGGFHVYIPHPGFRVPTLNSKSAKRIADAGFNGFDLKGDGGYSHFTARANVDRTNGFGLLIPISRLTSCPRDCVKRSDFHHDGVTVTATAPVMGMADRKPFLSGRLMKRSAGRIMAATSRGSG